MASPPNSILDSIGVLRLYKKRHKEIKAPEGLKCSLCKTILIDAFQTECGCRYCSECIDEYLEGGSKTCVGDFDECKKECIKRIRDTAINREVSQLAVTCLHDKCTHQSIIKDMPAHLATCSYREENCTLCGVSCLEMEMKDHQMNKCSMRKEECTYCHNTFTHTHLMNIHLDVENEGLCPKYQKICPYNCGVKGLVCVSQHREQCKNRPQRCVFHSLGCQKLMSNDKVSQHLIYSHQEHSDAIVKQLDELKRKITSLELANNGFREENKRLRDEAASQKSNVERRFAKIESQSGVSTTRPVNVNSATDANFRNGKFIWKVSSFRTLRESAIKGTDLSKISEPFYSSEFGYKICLKIYPNGDGVGKDTHLSVFFVVMRGEYDDILDWPFRNKIKLTLLDHSKRTTNHTDIFKPDAKSLCYQKPEGEFNIASGSPKFISFSDLNNFLTNDTLYLQIEVLP